MKMTKFFAGLLVLGTLAGCSKESGMDASEGVPTTASISIQVSAPGVRSAATRAASQVGEKEVATVDILVFDKAGVLETIKSGMTPDQTDPDQTKYQVTTSTGQKTIYAIVNNGGKVSNLTTGMTLQAFEQKAFEAAKADAATPGQEKIDVSIAKADNFLMFGQQAQVLDKDQAQNAVEIRVKRASAKSQVLFTDQVKQSANFQPANTAVTFSEAKSQLAQLQSSMFVALGGQFSDDTKILNWTTATTDNSLYNREDLWIAARAKGFDQANDGEMDAAAAVTAYSHYAPENKNATPQMKNTTCALIRVKIAPTTFTVNEGTQAGGTFYAIVKFNAADKVGDYKELASYYGIYKDQATANAELDKIDAGQKALYQVIEYTDGLSYYRLNLRDMQNGTNASERYSILRNNFYKVTVTEINNIGWNRPEDLVDPTDPTPVETETSLEATIVVEDWSDVDMNEPLG